MFRQVGVRYGAGCEIVAAIAPLSRGWVYEFALWAVHCRYVLVALRKIREVSVRVTDRSIERLTLHPDCTHHVGQMRNGLLNEMDFEIPHAQSIGANRLGTIPGPNLGNTLTKSPSRQFANFAGGSFWLDALNHADTI
jgi:hypothetical protein